MAMVVKNNMSAVRTLNTLNMNSTSLQKSLQKVSSGMKINSAQDDASGYAISERMRVRIRSLDQANQNTQNDSSLMKTAEGAVGNTVEILRALKEKAINAANDSNTDEDRQTIQKEINQFIDQIDDNALVQFNGKYLVDGSKNNASVASRTILLNQSLKVGTTVGSADEKGTKLIDMANRAGDSLGIQSTDKWQVSWVQNGTIHTASGTVGVQDLHSILTQSGVTGKAGVTDNEGLIGYKDQNLMLGYTKLSDDGLTAVKDGEGFTAAEILSMFSAAKFTEGSNAAALLTSTDIVDNDSATSAATAKTWTLSLDDLKGASGSGLNDGSLYKAGEDGLPEVLTGDITITQVVTTTYASDGTTVNGNKFTYTVSGIGSEEAIALYDSGADTTSDYIEAATLPSAGYTANAPGTSIEEIQKAMASDLGMDEADYTKIQDGALLKDIVPNYYLDTEGNSVSTGNYKVNISQGTEAAGATAGTKSTGYFSDGGTAINSNLTLYKKNPNKPDENPVTDKFEKSVYTPDKTQGIAFVADDSGVNNQISGLTISILDQDGNVKKAANAALDQFKQYQRAENQTGDKSLNFHIGSEANVAIKVGMSDMRSEALGLKGSDGSRVDVFTKEHANAAINVIENALTKALDQQTTIGAIEARLEYTSTNLTTSSENVQAAESTIRDADMAKEMTNYTKSNVLLQAAQAMLAQANQNSSAVLSLLQ